MDFNLCFTGAAGDGIKDAGILAAKLFAKLGYRTFVYQEYQSLIRGGHNASVVRVSDKAIGSHRYYYDLLVCLEDYVYERHKDRLKGVLIHDSKFKLGGLEVPMTEFVKEEHKPIFFRNAVVLGVIAYMFGIDFEVLEDVFIESYGNLASDDITLAESGYNYAEQNFDRIAELKKIGNERKVHSGAEMIALGMLRAGLERFYAYPMTPTSQILHFLVKRDDIVAYQPESEIAAIMMAIGSAFAGKRSATATSGGGFALMTESVSMAAMSETPILVIYGQRSSPSTGMATYTAQEDLYFALNPAHGEFPLIVASPVNSEDAFSLAAELLNLAWKYQTPAILLTEKHLLESYESVEYPKVKRERVKVVRRSEGVFKRYEVTESGVSPYAIPPAIVKANSNEHDEYGFTTDDGEVAKLMYAKRMRKMKMIESDVRGSYIVEGKGEEMIVTWGSNYGAVKEVAEELGFKVVAVRFLKPFDAPVIKDGSYCVECNYTGLLASMIEKEQGVKLRRVLRWDGRPFTPEELKEVIE